MADPQATPTVPSTPASPLSPDDGVSVTGEPAENAAEARLKGKGRERLLRGLQRISSSPSLARRGRPRSASSPYSLSGTISCGSLASASTPSAQHSIISSFSQSSATGHSNTPTSIPASPIPESPAIESALAVRKDGRAALAPTTASLPARLRKKGGIFSLWLALPNELKVHVLSFLRPKELVRASRVSKEFHKMCFDGQLWTCLDASEFYRDIPAESLTKIILSAGPFIKDLNLRGCVQVEYLKRAETMVKACRNLANATLEGCRNISRATLHSLIKANEKLVNLNLTGLAAVNNATCKIIAHSCPHLEMFNVSWCKQMDARGIKFVVERCPKLKDLRAGEIKGFNNIDLAETIFQTNNLERLVLSGCDDLSDAVLQTMIQGTDPEIDYLTDRPNVPPRKLRHLDLTRCVRLTTNGVKTLGYLVPNLEGLQLSGVSRLTDAALEPIFASTPRLTHLELEDIPELTNSLFSQHLAKAPCAPHLEHLSISYCEQVGDTGMLPIFRNCTRLRSVFMDNTRISDLVLAEAAAMVRERRSTRRRSSTSLPTIGLTLVAYDCPHVTWTGVREVLNRNTEAPRLPPSKKTEIGDNKDAVSATVIPADPTSSSSSFSTATTNNTETSIPSPSPSPSPPPPQKQQQQQPQQPPSYPPEIIALKCFYGWQMTVDEHTKRVLRGDVAAARRLERKWADYMQANEEAGVAGAHGRRRRRRAREAQAAHDEEEGGGGGGDGDGNGGGGGVGGRRRARTTVCAVM